MFRRQNKTQEKSESLLSSLWNSKGWFNPRASFSSASKKLLALTFLSQIESASGDVCFVSPNAPGGLGLYKLHCGNGQEPSLFQTLSQNCSVMGTGCGLSFFFTNTVQFGKSAFGYAVCTLQSMMPAEPCVVNVLDMKVLSGYVPALDGGPVAGLVIGGVAVAGVVGVGVYCRFFRKPKEAEANERMGLNTQVVPRTPGGGPDVRALSQRDYSTFGLTPEDLGLSQEDVRTMTDDLGLTSQDLGMTPNNANTVQRQLKF